VGGRRLNGGQRAVLLDTCAAIWLANGDPMSARSRRAIDAAATDNLGVYVSPISAWEIAMLVAKQKLQLSLSPADWWDALLDLPGVRLAGMPPSLLIASAALPGAPPGDPADRIIAATAREFSYVLITRDRKLLAYGRAGHLEAVRC
jgi:PIN domain nuclease of toxin-antitoxin system